MGYYRTKNYYNSNYRKKEIGTKVLSPYEIGILKSISKRKSDLIVEKALTKTKLDAYLNSEIVTELEDGTSVTMTAEDMIIVSAINDAINYGSFDKVKTLMELKGEIKGGNTTNIMINSKVDEDLLNRAIGGEQSEVIDVDFIEKKA